MNDGHEVTDGAAEQCDHTTSAIRLLPAVYVEMPPEKEELAVAAVAGLLDVIATREVGMALTSAGTWRSPLDEPSPRPGKGGDDGIEEDHDPPGPRPDGPRDDPGRPIPPDLH